jgi:hypothetical protein
VYHLKFTSQACKPIRSYLPMADVLFSLKVTEHRRANTSVIGRVTELFPCGSTDMWSLLISNCLRGNLYLLSCRKFPPVKEPGVRYNFHVIDYFTGS